MKAVYRAVQIAQPGALELVERETPLPAEGHVLLEVEACGI
jgi:alcohol dehydrogenase